MESNSFLTPYSSATVSAEQVQRTLFLAEKAEYLVEDTFWAAHVIDTLLTLLL